MGEVEAPPISGESERFDLSNPAQPLLKQLMFQGQSEKTSKED